MITYIEKGHSLHSAIGNAGFKLKDNTNDEAYDEQGNQSPEIDTAVQAIIDNYDPLPEAQAEAIDRVNTKAGEVRTKYVTNVPSQDATYQMKLNDANAFKLAEYPEADIANYPFIAGEALATQSTGQVATDLIIATATGWIQLAAGIENERRQSNEAIQRCTVWNDCAGIADLAIANLEAM